VGLENDQNGMEGEIENVGDGDNNEDDEQIFFQVQRLDTWPQFEQTIDQNNETYGMNHVEQIENPIIFSNIGNWKKQFEPSGHYNHFEHNVEQSIEISELQHFHKFQQTLLQHTLEQTPEQTPQYSDSESSSSSDSDPEKTHDSTTSYTTSSSCNSQSSPDTITPKILLSPSIAPTVTRTRTASFQFVFPSDPPQSTSSLSINPNTSFSLNDTTTTTPPTTTTTTTAILTPPDNLPTLKDTQNSNQIARLSVLDLRNNVVPLSRLHVLVPREKGSQLPPPRKPSRIFLSNEFDQFQSLVIERQTVQTRRMSDLELNQQEVLSGNASNASNSPTSSSSSSSSNQTDSTISNPKLTPPTTPSLTPPGSGLTLEFHPLPEDEFDLNPIEPIHHQLQSSPALSPSFCFSLFFDFSNFFTKISQKFGPILLPDLPKLPKYS
jgi:hypothetical protein